MKLAIINITGGNISGGYRAYLQEIIPKVAISSKVSTLLVGLPENVDFPTIRKDYPSVEWLKMRPAPFARSGIDSKAKNIIKIFNPDVIYIPTARYWSFKNIPVVNMNQNMEPYIPFVECNPLSEKIRLFLLKKEGTFAFRKARKVIAISNFVKDKLVNDSRIPESKIAVIHHGHYQITEKTKYAKPLSLPDTRKDNFIFTAGSIRPARGLEDILKALNHLKLKKVNINLVIAGNTVPNMQQYRKHLESYIFKNDLSNNIFWLDEINSAEMNWCYKKCKCFVMTSRIEACSIIALESMTHGCVTISSDNPPLPEIYTNTALFYPPRDHKFLAKIIMDVQSFSKKRIAQIRNNSMNKANDFNWDKCAATTIDLLVKVANTK